MSCLRKPFIPHTIEENVENLQRHKRKAMTDVANNQLVNKKGEWILPLQGNRKKWHVCWKRTLGKSQPPAKVTSIYCIDSNNILWIP